MTLNSLALQVVPQHLYQKSGANSDNRSLTVHPRKENPESFHYNVEGILSDILREIVKC